MPEQPDLGAEKPQTLSSPETRREARIFKVIEKNHEFAKAAYALEISFSDYGVKMENPDIWVKLEGLPEEIRKKFEQGIEKYLRGRAEMRRYVNFLEEYKEKLKPFVEEANTPREIGNTLFRQMIHGWGEPKGTIKFEIREGYLILAFSNKEDYFKARRGGGQPTDENIEERIAGTYHSSTYLSIDDKYNMGDNKISLPVIMIREDLPDAWKSTIIHERQHFINDNVFGMFYGLEFGPFYGPENTGKRTKEASLGEYNIRFARRRIKDEILAYIRDGSSGYNLESALFGELYSKLFLGLPEKEREEAKQVVREAANFLNRNRKFNPPNLRPLIVYQLVSVPLEEIPKWLNALGKYYEGKMRLMEPFNSVYNVNEFYFSSSINLQSLLPNGVEYFPENFREKAESVMGKAQRDFGFMKKLYEEAEEKVFDPLFTIEESKEKIERLSSQYRSTYEELIETLKQLETENSFPPSASETTVYEFGDPDFPVNEDTEATKKIRSEVLEFINQIPHETVQEVFDYLNSKDSSTKKSLSIAKLLNQINQIIYQINGSCKCYSSIDISEDFTDALIIYTNFWLPKDERKYKEASINFTLHAKSPLKK